MNTIGIVDAAKPESQFGIQDLASSANRTSFIYSSLIRYAYIKGMSWLIEIA